MLTTVTAASKLSESIIDCARTNFFNHGYKRTTVDDIARTLHISKRTLYTFFSSKEELLREVAWRDTRESMRIFAVTAPTGAPPEQMLLELCRYVLADRAKKGKSGTFFGLYLDDTRLREAFQDAFRGILANLYEDGMRHGRLKPVTPELAGATIFAMLEAATGRFHLLPNPLASFTVTLNMIADAVAFQNRTPIDTAR